MSAGSFFSRKASREGSESGLRWEGARAALERRAFLMDLGLKDWNRGC